MSVLGMSDPLILLRNDCQLTLTETVAQLYPEVEIPYQKFAQTPNPTMGELSSSICFQLAKELKQKPADIAVQLVKSFKPKGLMLSAEAINGYINFHADPEKFGRLVIETACLYSEFGFIKIEKPKKVMVEHTSANPIHPLTIGHARNGILGACLAEMIKLRGHELSIHFLVNDMGRQVALATYGWSLLGQLEPNIRGELFVGAIYASTNVNIELKRVAKELKVAEEKEDLNMMVELQEEREKFEAAATDLEKSYPYVFTSLKEKIKFIDNPMADVIKLNTSYENNELETVKVVRSLVQICLDGFKQSLGEMGITYDSFDFESNLVWAKKADIVLEALKKSNFVELNEGAIVLDCNNVANIYKLKEAWGLSISHEIPHLVLVRKDGTTLYTLRDIAYSIYKFDECKVDQVINVIGQEQALAQLQLRIALVALGKRWMGDSQRHYGYEFVKLPEGKMSGRLGRFVTLLDVVDKSIELAFEEVTKRTPDMPEEQRRNIARMVGYGAVKYTLLSVDSNKTVIFDWAKALNFETNSAPFIQYSHARCCNILKKALEKPKANYSLLTNIKEKELIMLIASFPEIFTSAADELKPGIITSYANTLADKFNSFYQSIRVLNANNAELIGARLALVDATRVVLHNSLQVLGIEAPERM